MSIRGDRGNDGIAQILANSHFDETICHSSPSFSGPRYERRMREHVGWGGSFLLLKNSALRKMEVGQEKSCQQVV